jgi:hypothetical protein
VEGRISDKSPPTGGEELTDHRSPITDNRSPITDHRSPITDYRSPITDYRSPTTDQAWYLGKLVPTQKEMGDPKGAQLRSKKQ